MTTTLLPKYAPVSPVDGVMPQSGGRVQKRIVEGFKHFSEVINSRGQKFTFGLVVGNLPNKETYGDYDLRIRNAAVLHEQIGREGGREAKAIRVSPLPGAHLAKENEKNAAVPSDTPGDSFTGVFAPIEKQAINPNNRVQVELNVLPGFERAYEAYEKGAQLLERPKLSTKGYGSAFIGALGTQFKVSASGHRTDVTSVDMLVETLLTKYASFYENYTGITSLSRQSFGKSSIEGVVGVPTKPQEFSFSLPLKCTNPHDELRNERAPGEIIPMTPDTSVFADVLNDPPKEWKNSSDPKLVAKYHDAVPIKYRAAFEGKCNPDSGIGMARIVVVSSADVKDDGIPPVLKHRLRVQQAIANWCEEFCAPAELTPEELAAYPGHARIPGTFSIMENLASSEKGKNLAQIDPTLVTDLYETVVQIPFTEMSLFARTLPQRNVDGSTIAYLIDENGNRQMLIPPPKQEMHARRNERNAPGKKGVFGESGGGMKMIEIDYPYDQKQTHYFENYVCMTVASACTDEFENKAYAYDSFQGGPALYNLGTNQEPNNRAQIYLAGWNKLIAAMERPAQQEVTGWHQPAFIGEANSKPVDRLGKELHKETAGYNKRVFAIWRDLNGQWPEIFKDTAWIEMAQAVYDDVRAACEVKWIDDEKKEGYLVMHRMAGIDNELPAVLFNTLIIAAVANSMDELNRGLPEGKRVSWTQTDLVRSWPQAFFRIRDKDIADAMRKMGVDPRYLPEDQEDPSIITTYEDSPAFEYRFVVKVKREDDPYYKGETKTRLQYSPDGSLENLPESVSKFRNDVVKALGTDNPTLSSDLITYLDELRQQTDPSLALKGEISTIYSSALARSFGVIEMDALTDPSSAAIKGKLSINEVFAKWKATHFDATDNYEQFQSDVLDIFSNRLGVFKPLEFNTLTMDLLLEELQNIHDGTKDESKKNTLEHLLRTNGLFLGKLIADHGNESQILRYAYLMDRNVYDTGILPWSKQDDAQKLMRYASGNQTIPTTELQELVQKERSAIQSRLCISKIWRDLDGLMVLHPGRLRELRKRIEEYYAQGA
jgi:hypothetical protein